MTAADNMERKLFTEILGSVILRMIMDHRKNDVPADRDFFVELGKRVKAFDPRASEVLSATIKAGVLEH